MITSLNILLIISVYLVPMNTWSYVIGTYAADNLVTVKEYSNFEHVDLLKIDDVNIISREQK